MAMHINRDETSGREQTGQRIIWQLFDSTFAWDSLPFTILNRSAFHKDFHNGSSRFCSPALVNALLAFSTRVIIESAPKSASVPQGWSGSSTFFEKAEQLLSADASSDRLPDIQARGVLSLYKFSCGCELAAQELADAFVTGIKDLCRREYSSSTQNDFQQALATSYCGAVSLIR